MQGDLEVQRDGSLEKGSLELVSTTQPNGGGLATANNGGIAIIKGASIDVGKSNTLNTISYNERIESKE